MKHQGRDEALASFEDYLLSGNDEIHIELITPSTICSMHFDTSEEAIKVFDAVVMNWKQPPKTGKCGMYIPFFGWTPLHHQTLKDAWRHKGIDELRYRCDTRRRDECFGI